MNKKVVEINGSKFEVDMDSAERIDTFKVGDNVKLFSRQYGESQIFSGVILGFYNFKNLPTIQVAYFENSFSVDGSIKFVNINSETKDFELLPANSYEAHFDRDGVMDSLNRKIEEATANVRDLKAKKAWFMKYYGKVFKPDKDGVSHEQTIADQDTNRLVAPTTEELKRNEHS